MTTKQLAALVGMSVILAGCGSKNPIRLDVDLYLHPQASQPTDLVLQAAIRKRLAKFQEKRSVIVHVRVLEGIVYLSGTAKTEKDIGKVDLIARTTEVTLHKVDGEDVKLRPKCIVNRMNGQHPAGLEGCIAIDEKQGKP
jgi:hypothetical protein